jgi:ABC-type transporter MlaC component
MLRPSAVGRTMGSVVLPAFRTGVTMGSIICWVVLFGRAAAAQTDPQVAEFLTSINTSITELAGQTGSQASLTCSRIVASAINLGAVAESALGHVWDRMTSQQRAAHRVAAQRWAVRDCVRRNQDIGGNPLEFLGVRQGVAGERLLATRSSQPAHTVIWRLRGSGRVRAVDIVIDGRSMILSLRDDMKALLDRNGGDIDMAIGALGR